MVTMKRLTTRNYWDAQWQSENLLPDRFNSVGNFLNRAYRQAFHRFFVSQFGNTTEKALLEVGCGRSQLLPYFAVELGFAHPSGLDYSEPGCKVAREILRKYSVDGIIYCGDLWDEAATHGKKFDIIISCGVIEHFEDTAATIRAISRHCASEGEVLSVIPNMRGLPGALQQAVDKDVYELHVPVSLQALIDAHQSAGLVILDSGYILPAHFGVVGLSAARRTFVRKLALSSALYFSTSLQILDRWVRLPRSEMLSPYLFVRAKMPGAVQG